MSYNLFALTSDPANRIVRFELSQEVQDEFTAFLQTQEQQFNNFAKKEISFDGKYKPDIGEVLVIENYDDIDSLAQAIKNPLGLPEITPSCETFDSIKALFSGYTDQNGTTTVLIQHFDKRKIISTNGLSIFHSANVYKKIEDIGITIDSKLSATLKNNSLRILQLSHVATDF